MSQWHELSFRNIIDFTFFCILSSFATPDSSTFLLKKTDDPARPVRLWRMFLDFLHPKFHSGRCDALDDGD